MTFIVVTIHFSPPSLFSLAKTKKTGGNGWLNERPGTFGGNGQSTTSLDGVSFSEGELLLQVIHMEMHQYLDLIPCEFPGIIILTSHLFTHYIYTFYKYLVPHFPPKMAQFV